MYIIIYNYIYIYVYIQIYIIICIYNYIYDNDNDNGHMFPAKWPACMQAMPRHLSASLPALPWSADSSTGIWGPVVSPVHPSVVSGLDLCLPVAFCFTLGLDPIS